MTTKLQIPLPFQIPWYSYADLSFQVNTFLLMECRLNHKTSMYHIHYPWITSLIKLQSPSVLIGSSSDTWWVYKQMSAAGSQAAMRNLPSLSHRCVLLQVMPRTKIVERRKVPRAAGASSTLILLQVSTVNKYSQIWHSRDSVQEKIKVSSRHSSLQTTFTAR